MDCPDFGGFVSSTTVIKADYWRIGQMKAGDTLQYHRVSLKDALGIRKVINSFINQIAAACFGKGTFDHVSALDYSHLPSSMTLGQSGKAVLHRIEVRGNQPLTVYRQVSIVKPKLL